MSLRLSRAALSRRPKGVEPRRSAAGRPVIDARRSTPHAGGYGAERVPSRVAGVIAAILGVAIAFQARAAESYVLATTTQAPVIDGRLDEPCWQQATALDRFVLLGGIEPPPDQRAATRALLTADQANLYLGIVCEEPLVAKLTQRHTERDSDVWQDDDVEVMIMPCAQGVDRYVQICANPAGALLDGYLPGPAAPMDKGYDSEAEVSARVGASDWTVELRLPLANLPVESPAGPWYLHVARARRTTGQYLASLRTPVASFHETRAFAELTGLEALRIPFGIKDFSFGQRLCGTTDCTALVEGDRQRLSGAEIEIGGQRRASFDPAALAITAGALSLPFSIAPGDRDKALVVRFLDGARVVQRRSTVLGALPADLLGGLTRPAYYLSANEAVTIELPVNLLSSRQEPLAVTWTAADEQGETLGAGQTETTGRSTRIRLYWPRWRPGSYRLAVTLLQRGTEVARRTYPLRLVSNPWEDLP